MRGTLRAMFVSVEPGCVLGSADYFGGVLGHGAADVGGIELAPVVDGEPAQIPEVLDIQVGRERADEPGRFAERVGEGVWRPGRDSDARPCSGVDAVGSGGESERPLSHDEGFIVLVVDVLRRAARTGRHDRLVETETVLSVRAVLDDAAANRATAGLLPLVRTHDTDRHDCSFDKMTCCTTKRAPGASYSPCPACSRLRANS